MSKATHYGRLGHGDEENQFTPRLESAAVFNGERVVVVFVAAGGHHTVAVPVGGRRTQTLHPLIPCQMLDPDRAWFL